MGGVAHGPGPGFLSPPWSFPAQSSHVGICGEWWQHTAAACVLGATAGTKVCSTTS